MNKRVTILLLLFLTSIPALFAQTIEDKKRIDVQTSVNAGEQLLQTQPIKPELPDEVNKKAAYPMIMKNIPILTDFYRFQQNHIYKQFSFVGSGQKVSYIGLGEYISINGAIRWMPSKRLSVDAGGIFSRQFYFASPLFRQDIMGVNTKMQYVLTNSITLNIWGQYIFPGEPSPFSAYNPLFPHTGVGVSVSVDLKKDAEISVGAEYQYDNKSRKWKLESSGRVSIGF